MLTPRGKQDAEKTSDIAQLHITIPPSEDIDLLEKIKALEERVAKQEEYIKLQAELIEKFKQDLEEATAEFVAINARMQDRHKYYTMIGDIFGITTDNSPTPPVTNTSISSSTSARGNGPSLWARAILHTRSPLQPDEEKHKQNKFRFTPSSTGSE